MARARCRQLGVTVGDLPPGAHNAITDVPGVAVGHVTLVEGEGPLRPGRGPVRTGVTVVLPHPGNIFRQKVRAGQAVINGYGKATGLVQVTELGELETPIALTNTLNVGLVWDALVDHMQRTNPDLAVSTTTVNPVVAECNDSYLNDIWGRHVRPEHVAAALESAGRGRVAEGNVGAGTGMSAFGYKGGIGTASRVLATPEGSFTLGCLALVNFGRARDLRIGGVPVGRVLGQQETGPPPPPGSIVLVIGTDAPLSSRQLNRVALRAAAGLARTGSYYSNGSGDFVITFTTATLVDSEDRGIAVQGVAADRGAVMDGLFRAAADTVEESIYNAMFTAESMVGRDGHRRRALPVDDVLEVLAKHGWDPITTKEEKP
jgi:D-aminopeptidase